MVRNTNLNIRTNNEDKNLINKAAILSKKTITDFVLDAACREAEEVLFNKKWYNLEEERFTEFMNLLDMPIKENKKLCKLLNKKTLWED